MIIHRPQPYARRSLWRWLDVDPWAVCIVLGGIVVALAVERRRAPASRARMEDPVAKDDGAMTPDEIRQIRETIDRRSLQGTTHYEDCWREHLACAAIRLCDALEAERRIAEAKDAVIQELLQCKTFHAWPELEDALRRLAEAQEE